jgi:hypothetical protein
MMLFCCAGSNPRASSFFPVCARTWVLLLLQPLSPQPPAPLTEAALRERATDTKNKIHQTFGDVIVLFS